MAFSCDLCSNSVIRKFSLILPENGSSPTRSLQVGKTVVYMTSDGRVIEASKIKKDSKVHVHYIKEGNDMLVDKVTVTEVRD